MGTSAFVYVAPARYEDILKLGFSHDPCDRVRSFHRRYFAYFDLQRSFAIAATDEADARRIERLLARRFADHRTRAPLEIETAPGGITEWYRGAYDLLCQTTAELVEAGGYPPPINLAGWIRDKLIAERDLLFEFATNVIDAADGLGASPESDVLIRTFNTSLEAYHSFGIDVADYLPADAWRLARLP